MSVHFLGEVPKVLKDRKRLKMFIMSIIEEFKKEVGVINFSFVNDDSILEANKTFLQHDYYTDIITFDLSTNKRIIDADIIISHETVESNALKFETAYFKELHRVIFHGILHLCGLDDKSKADKLKMRAAEDLYLDTYFR